MDLGSSFPLIRDPPPRNRNPNLLDLLPAVDDCLELNEWGPYTTTYQGTSRKSHLPSLHLHGASRLQGDTSDRRWEMFEFSLLNPLILDSSVRSLVCIRVWVLACGDLDGFLTLPTPSIVNKYNERGYMKNFLSNKKGKISTPWSKFSNKTRNVSN